MIIVKKQKGENIERMLNRYKTKAIRTKLIKNLKDRSEYVKPSTARRKQREKAIAVRKYNQKHDIED